MATRLLYHQKDKDDVWRESELGICEDRPIDVLDALFPYYRISGYRGLHLPWDNFGFGCDGMLHPPTRGYVIQAYDERDLRRGIEVTGVFDDFQLAKAELGKMREMTSAARKNGLRAVANHYFPQKLSELEGWLKVPTNWRGKQRFGKGQDAGFIDSLHNAYAFRELACVVFEKPCIQKRELMKLLQ